MIREFVDKYIAYPTHLMNITVEITSTCNLKCCHCYVDDRLAQQQQRHLSLDDIKCIINQVKELNTITVTLTGGEPMAHPNFAEIIKFIKESGFIAFLKTNGTLINSSNIDIIKRYVDTVYLSRYGFSQKTYESVTGVSGSYEKFNTALILLKYHKVPYTENAILLKENESEIDEFLSSGLKIEQYISANKDNPYARKHRANDSTLYRYYYNLLSKPGFEFTQYFNDANSIKSVCNCGVCSLTINAYGDINPCTNFYYALGNIRTDRIYNVWNSMVKADIQERCKVKCFQKCSSCSSNNYLLSIAPCNNFAETGNINNVSTEMCRHCKIIERVHNDIISKHM